ncbi:MAG: hypothetical protein LBL21_03095 [Rickettsiales bacterium]|jgi:hypothetical protein|nr:hypothetical protein [Rickettsiales bacterium]
MKKTLSLVSCLLSLFACSSPNSGNIDNATILNWENESVTSEQFVKDHKACLGVDRPAHMPRSRVAKLLMPNAGNQMPDWEGMWVTFQSNENRDIPQRYMMSSPPGTTSKSVGAYRKCMFRKGYLLRAE